ncbi:hypothetical protein N7532_010984 [Penicillium argentinense]|uniref:G protein-coupled receptor GPR1/2/3 C-terminal domain-containing protein n=1 Tax=Penicillium argentinense TaxID=1131581 RepID=A0A9W9EQL9_9EURO|nr:uncharacterized protein N7532_010984 [Penicillium argentinense]KAJ5086213.1 hypothetical protein N7532_010984 [Penicillium argentinense]
MSGMFVLAIAMYTFIHIILGYQLGHRIFVAAVVCLWIFGVVIVVIPIATIGRYVWFPAVAWQCWIPTEQPVLRLWTHYFWIFAAQCLTILLYVVIFVQLRRKIAECILLGGQNTSSLRHLNRVASCMILYPIVYITLSLPLAVGRMESVNGHTPSVTYFCIAGSLLASSGLCNTLLYALTRKNSVMPPERTPMADNRYGRPASRRGGESTKSNARPRMIEHWGNTCSTGVAPHYDDPTPESIPNGGFEQDLDFGLADTPAHPMDHNDPPSDGW